MSELGELIRRERWRREEQKEREMAKSEVKELVTQVCNKLGITEPRLRYRMDGNAAYSQSLKSLSLPGYSFEEIGARFRSAAKEETLQHFDKLLGLRFLRLTDRKLGIAITIHELGHHYDTVTGTIDKLVEQNVQVMHSIDSYKELPTERSADEFMVKMMKEGI